ncbi:SET domain-containing protein [Aureobasidium namibiae CBS 147.97]|uniref:SET domain-containing protein n=1 Tax=Aureobasidium namibiae CBS 147.97 TaxID=1043004 RepID=A0A074WLJ8_9PEZI
MDAFEEWFRSNGGYLHPSIQLAQDAEQGSHFQASAVIEPGTHVLTVPHNLAMSNLNAQVDDDFPVFRTHAQQFTVEGLSFFYLMAQWLNKDKSFWKPYLDILPSPERGFETPMFYDEDDRQWLEGTDLYPTLLGREAAWTKYWEDGVQVMKSAGVDVTNYTCQHWTAYKHGPNGTQTVLLNHNDYPEDWKKFSVLFPAIDIGNHNPNARVDWAYDPDCFSLTVSEKIESGSQVYNNYGPKSSEELLMGYGFCAPNNPYDGLLLAMRPPPPPLQQMLSITHPEYFKESGEWNSEAATFRLLHAKLQETNDASPFDQAWGCVPAPLAELFCYVVQLERGLDVAPTEDAEEYLYHGEGRRYLPRIALYIMMSLIPKISKLEEANEKLPSAPTNHRQASTKIYRDLQYEVINSVQERMANYLKDLQPEEVSSDAGSAVWTFEDAVDLLELEMPAAHKSFMSGVKYVTGTTKLRRLRGSEHEEYLWTILLCFLYLACTSQTAAPGLISQWIQSLVAEYGEPDLQASTSDDDETDEEAAEYLDRVKKAAMFLPGSLWTSEAWSADFVLDFGMRISKSQGTYMDIGDEEVGEDVRYVVYLHV